MGLAGSDGAVPLRIGAMDPMLGCSIAAAPAAPTQRWPTRWLCPNCSGAGRKRLWGENRQNSEQRWDLQVRGLGCILRGAGLGPAGARQWAAPRDSLITPPARSQPGRAHGRAAGCPGRPAAAWVRVVAYSWVLQPAGQGRGQAAPSQVSPDPGNPQQLEPGARPAPATAALAKAPSSRGEKQVFGDPRPRQRPVTPTLCPWTPGTLLLAAGQGAVPAGDQPCFPLPAGARMPGSRPRKELRCARKLADF